jgi:regulator of extracellular matrix RemA (YlzA/DUF370 family)
VEEESAPAKALKSDNQANKKLINPKAGAKTNDQDRSPF